MARPPPAAASGDRRRRSGHPRVLRLHRLNRRAHSTAAVQPIAVAVTVFAAAPAQPCPVFP
uniref:Uncharacterized protein n=1 Tax=Leersia perrieri TaxID=77586 RepID=A0A0D9W3W7_9ORYZ